MSKFDIHKGNFKVGDRVKFYMEGDSTSTDYGMLIRYDNEVNKWWALWDSSGVELYSGIEHLTLIPAFAPQEQELINSMKEPTLDTPIDSEHSLTVTSITLHRSNESCIFGESNTVISLQDEAGGLFLELSQCNDTTENGKIRLGFEELPLIIQAVDYLKNQKAVIREERVQQEQKIKYMKVLNGVING